MNSCIQMVDVSKRYRKVEAVKSLSFSVPRGSLCAFVGSNGAGKSTTMNMMITLIKKNSGKIYVEGMDIDDSKEEIRRKIGVVFQEDVLDPELTVYENLYYRGGLYITDKKLLKHRIADVSRILSLESILPKRYGTCSGGQKRLTQIGRAILPSPPVIILDEPTIGLDPLAREQVWKMLNHLNQAQHITIFYSTHYMEEAAMAKQVLMIHEGCLLLCQNVNKLYQTTSPDYACARLHEIYMEVLQRYAASKESMIVDEDVYV